MRRATRAARLSGLLLAAVLPSALRAEAGSSVPDFDLLDQDGQAHELYDRGADRVVALVSLARACPGAEADALDLRGPCAEAGVTCLGIDADAADGAAALKRYARERGWAFPLLRDPSGAVSEALGLRSAGRMVVVDPRSWTAVYRGRAGARALAAALAGAPLAGAEDAGAGCPLPGVSTRTLTYVDDAAPVLVRRCAECHRAGAASGPVFDGYESVRGWREMMRETILTHRMPPSYQDPDYGRFTNAPALEPGELRVLARWLGGDAPRGAGGDPLADYVAPPRARADPDLELRALGAVVVSSAETGVVRLLTLAGPTREDLWLQGLRYDVGNPAVAEHMALSASPAPVQETETRTMEVHNQAPFFWHEGGLDSFRMPPGFAWLVPKGSYLVLSVHYVGDGKAETDRSGVGLYLYKGPGKPRRMSYDYLTMHALSIPPGARDYRVTARRRFERPVRLYGLGFHGHYRVRWARYTAQYPDGRREVLLSLPWLWREPMRSFYRFDVPKRLPAGTSLEVVGSYDNSASNPVNPDPGRRVTWGDDVLQDEMFKGSIRYAEDD